MAITSKKNAATATTATRYGGLSLDGTQVLTYLEDGKTWVSKRSLNPTNLAAMLAGCYGIDRRGKEVLKPRTEVNPKYSCIDLRSMESLQDPMVLDAIEILDNEGSDISAISDHIALLHAGTSTPEDVLIIEGENAPVDA